MRLYQLEDTNVYMNVIFIDDELDAEATTEFFSVVQNEGETASVAVPVKSMELQ